MRKARLGKRERKAKQLANQGKLQRRYAARGNSDETNDVLKGCIEKLWLNNTGSGMLSSDRLQSITHNTTCFRAGVSNLRDGKNITYGKLGITVHVPGQMSGKLAKLANAKNMRQALGLKQRFSEQPRQSLCNKVKVIRNGVIINEV